MRPQRYASDELTHIVAGDFARTAFKPPKLKTHDALPEAPTSPAVGAEAPLAAMRSN